jgi:hypothetical protein
MWGLKSVVRGLGKNLGFVQAVILGNASSIWPCWWSIRRAADGRAVLDRGSQPGGADPARGF